MTKGKFTRWFILGIIVYVTGWALDALGASIGFTLIVLGLASTITLIICFGLGGFGDEL